MVEKDTPYTTFYGDNDLYHYFVMPLGHINAGVIYKRMVKMLFIDMIRDLMEGYVDDMLVNLKLGVDQKDLEVLKRLTFYRYVD